jgi:hypothetical protein
VLVTDLTAAMVVAAAPVRDRVSEHPAVVC